jgi:hypothetical protein
MLSQSVLFFRTKSKDFDTQLVGKIYCVRVQKVGIFRNSSVSTPSVLRIEVALISIIRKWWWFEP